MDAHQKNILKLSLLDKLKIINQNQTINNITLGPHSIKNLSLNSTPNYKTPTKNEEKPLKKKTQRSPVPVSSRDTAKKEFFNVLELERQKGVEKSINDRLKVFKEFNESQNEKAKEAWVQIQQGFISDMEEQTNKIMEENSKFHLKQSAQQAKMDQLTQSAIKRLRDKAEMIKEKEKERQILSEYVNKIKTNQQKFGVEFQQILGLLKACSDNAELKNSKQLDFSLLKTLPTEVEALIEKCKPENVMSVNEGDVKKSEEIINKMVDFKAKFKSEVEAINEKIKAAQVKAEEAKKVPPKPVNIPKPVMPVISTATTAEPNATKANIQENINKLSKYVSMGDLEAYTELIAFHEQFKKSYDSVENDPALKNFRFDLKKAVNIPVNSLSGVNAGHILDKYSKLHRLLSGQSVLVSNKEVNASRHPQGVNFCMDILARQFVKQGDLMVSSNPESAFCYASVILSLWNDFPVFGRLILANFYSTCPYLVPYYIPRQVGESDEEFYRKLGYLYSDGEVEKQDKFLKRMTGTMRLFFTLMIAKPKRGQSTSPMDLRNAWKWLATFLKLEPQLDITATALHVFLESLGLQMDQKYRRMFQKVLSAIIQVFLPKCKAVKCTGGAVTRVELLLTKYIENKTFEKPQGYTDFSLW
ncbi:mRNA export factor Gle1 [Anthonomus grandis grandis]|uniref:mRNA export factor Gle1 n=1 Tax=Anthonomus grandis grandis TaxID=2921223 RepID=UPI002165EAC4|nr:mRNA export factor Gle1 [Anthonomus grandis grandis]